MEDIPNEFIKPLLLSFDILDRCNLQIFKRDLVWNRLRYLYMIPFVFIFYISTILYTVKMFSEDHPVSELAFMMSVFFIIIQVSFKAAIIIPKKANLAELVTKLGIIWRTEHLNERQMRKKEFILNRLNLCLKVFYWCSIIPAWNVVLAPAFITLGKFLLGQEIEFQLPFGSVLPFDPLDNWFRYIVVYMFQVYSIFRFVYIYIGTEILMVTLCALLSIEFALLRDDFGHYTVNREENSSAVMTLIRKHQQLLLYGKWLDNIFNKMLFYDLLFVTVVMCFFGFGATVARGVLEIVNNFIAVLALLLPTFIFCYYGEQLKEESAGIAESAYSNKWYTGSVNYQKVICFVITRAQMPTCLTSLGYVPVTLNTFSKVVSTTWSYFSLIRSVYNKEQN